MRSRLELASDVVFARDDQHLWVRQSLWEVKVPLEAIASDPALSDLVHRRVVDQTRVGSKSIGFLQLLESQGCFLPERPAWLTPDDVLGLFRRIRSRLYASYYSHPLWLDLRSGLAGRGALIAWVLHNYHVSRSAGPIAARLAADGRNSSASRFQQDALDEFWHCDSFYFVEGQQIGLSAEQGKASVPLPASTAFEDLARRTAEEDHLGHVLIALFQEASVAFNTDADAFYNAVEERYGLPGFFEGWRRHMHLDEEQDHAAGVAAALNDIGDVPADLFERAARRVVMAHFFLCSALTQASEFGADQELSLRQPKHVVRTVAGADLPFIALPDTLHLFGFLKRAALVALSHAREHDDIMVAGRLCAALEHVREPQTPLTKPWLAACNNFLLDRAVDTGALIPLVQEICRSACQDPTAAKVLAALPDAESQQPRKVSSKSERASVQLRELLALAQSCQAEVPYQVFAES